MFDLDEELRRWRRETELTLAFEPDEIDELEDHLKLAVEKAIAQGASPEEAWRSAAARLGDSPPLAAEFAKSKLMPALFHLVSSWWQVGLLFVLFSLHFASTFSMNWPSLVPDNGGPRYTFWTIAWISFTALVALTPGRAARNALLLGVGNAFCLIPLLYACAYNSLGDHLIGAGWSRMGAPMGWWPLTIALVGVGVLNCWGWRRCRRENFTTTLAISAAIILVMAIAPFVGEVIGNLSIRELYHLPTAQEIPYTGDVKTQYMQWKFVDILINSIEIIATWLPLTLALIISGGIVALQRVARRFGREEPQPALAFPDARELPWGCGLIGGGASWFWAAVIEPPFSQQIRLTEQGVHHATSAYFGVALMTLGSALVVLTCAYELTCSLTRAKSVRPFYAGMFVAFEGAVLVGVCAAPLLLNPTDRSSLPLWLSTSLHLAIVAFASAQILQIGKRARAQRIEPSTWHFNARDLVRLGAMLGLIGACCGLFLMSPALVLAFVSTAMISALINWGNSIEHPGKPFNPFTYDSPAGMATQTHYPTPHLDFWIFSGLSYLSFCLMCGFAVAIVLSGLEFIRFNTYRYYKVRKAERARHDVLAVNE